MADVVKYQSAEAWVVAYLTGKVPCEVGTRYPIQGTNTSPVDFVRVQLAGGFDTGSGKSGKALVLSDRVITVQCWGVTKMQAANLVEDCFAYLKAAPRDSAQSVVRRATTIGGPAYMPDNGNHRYQITMSLTFRGIVVS